MPIATVFSLSSWLPPPPPLPQAAARHSELSPLTVGTPFLHPTLRRIRLHTLEFSNAKLIRSIHTGGVAALDLDAVEQRYLLAGAGDASIAVYDTQQPSPEAEAAAQAAARDAAGAEAALAGGARALRASAQAGVAAANAEHTEHAALLSIGKAAPGAHRFSVSAVAWYPVDTGLFVSGEAPRGACLHARPPALPCPALPCICVSPPCVARPFCRPACWIRCPVAPPPLSPCRLPPPPPPGGFDSEVKVWDTNSQAVVVSFSLAARVYAAAMSANAASHCLVAVGSGDTQARNCRASRWRAGPAPWCMGMGGMHGAAALSFRAQGFAAAAPRPCWPGSHSLCLPRRSSCSGAGPPALHAPTTCPQRLHPSLPAGHAV